jgi:hypothetical protein
MANLNRTSGELQVPQPLLEVLQKLIEAGSPPETISIATGIDIEEIRKLLANHPKQLAKLVETIQEKSRRFRCAQSNRLMVSPVLAADENYYEESILQAHPVLSSKQVMRHSKFKEEIAEFSRDSLKALEGCLHQKEAQEDALQLTAECLSVLSLEADLESVLKILGAVEGKEVRVLTAKLSDLVSVEYLLSLMNQTVRPLTYQALCLAKLVILHPLSERAYEEAFSCFTEQLGQTSLSQAVVELVEEISERLSSSQLGRLNSVLERQPSEERLEDKLEALKLKEAYLRLREGDIETAASIVSTLHKNPHLEEEVLKFYEEAGMPSAKLTILKHRLGASLEALRPESPAVAATISIVCQVFDTELLTLKTESATQESFISLRAEVGALRAAVAKAENSAKQVTASQEALIQKLEQSQTTEAALQESFISLRAEIDVVHRTVTEARREAASRIQRLEDQSERRKKTDEESLKTLKGELETLKSELAETQRLLQCTRDQADHLVEVTRELKLLCTCKEAASSISLEEYQTSPYVLSSSDTPASAQYALSPFCDIQRSTKSPALASSVVSSLSSCDVCTRSRVDVELSCRHKCCQGCFDTYLSILAAIPEDTSQVKCFIPICEEVIEEHILKALLSKDQLLKLAPKSMLCKRSKGRLCDATDH